MTRYKATASRVSGWWMVQCDQHPGALSQVRRLDQAAQVHREAIAFVAQVPIDDVQVEIRPELPANVREELGEAERLTVPAQPRSPKPRLGGGGVTLPRSWHMTASLFATSAPYWGSRTSGFINCSTIARRRAPDRY